MNVSVIIPAYNAERYLTDAIKSVQSQTATDWELIVVDDGSTDTTPDIVRAVAVSDPRLRLVQRANGGLPAARNSGIRAASETSKFISFLDGDDLWEPDALEILLGALERSPECLGAHALSRYVDADNQPIREGELEGRGLRRQTLGHQGTCELTSEMPTTFDVLAIRNCFTVGAILLRKSAFDRAGLFDEELRACEDWDLWLRMCVHGNIAFTNRVVCRYRQHGSNMSHDPMRMGAADAAVRLKLCTLPNLDSRQRAIARAAMRRHATKLMRLRYGWCLEAMRNGHIVDATKQLRHATQAGLVALRA